MSSVCLFAGMAKKTRPLSEEALVLVARRFAVLAEPMRLRLLQALIEGEKSVGALAEEAGGTQANVSRHLQTLAEAGLVSRRKDGLQVFYAIADPTIFQLCELVCGSIDQQMQARAKAFR
jgi:ArsR family transcriptional regulator